MIAEKKSLQYCYKEILKIDIRQSRKEYMQCLTNIRQVLRHFRILIHLSKYVGPEETLMKVSFQRELVTFEQMHLTHIETLCLP